MAYIDAKSPPRSRAPKVLAISVAIVLVSKKAKRFERQETPDSCANLLVGPMCDAPNFSSFSSTWPVYIGMPDLIHQDLADAAKQDPRNQICHEGDTFRGP